MKSLKNLAFLYLNSFTKGGLQRVSKKPHIFRFIYFGNRRFPLLYLVLLSLFYYRKKVYYLCTFYWYVNSSTVKNVKRGHVRFEMFFPNHKIINLANSPEELSFLKGENLSSILCNQNCLVDEKIYKPIISDKKFDAVYDARITPFKRHALATSVPNLALITYVYAPSKVNNYTSYISNLLTNTFRFNLDANGKYNFLNDHEVNDAINQCKVGLILSEEEGANYASIQYLLAGLPIVSTPSKGGRDVFFDDYNTIIIEPDAQKVADAVKMMIERKPDPNLIRETAIKRMNVHREYFIDLINQIYKKEEVNRDFNDEWDALFYNKFIKMVRFWKVIRLLDVITKYPLPEQ